MMCGLCGMLHTVEAKVTNEPDSVFLFSYATTQDAGRSGLKYAWSPDRKQWNDIGNGLSYVRCDYGPWGREKRMFNPRLWRSADGVWHCIWQLNESKHELGHASSEDLMKWSSQNYFAEAELSTYLPTHPQMAEETAVQLEGASLHGWMQKASWQEVEALIKNAAYLSYRETLHNERTEQDVQRFAGLKTVKVTIGVKEQEAKQISDKLIGIFFEDINYAADGGLYAELVQNRGFEYSAADRREWNSTYAWSIEGEGLSLSIDTVQPIHPNNPHYALLQVKNLGGSLQNSGFDGIAIRKGEKYDVSFFGKVLDGKGGKWIVKLITPQGVLLAQTAVNISTGEWKKQKTVLVANADAVNAVLSLSPQTVGTYAMDMVSLFPQKTFKNRKNGMRADLAQLLANLRPRFVRFPGGCVAHGDGLDNIYRWKNTIGELEARKPMRNLWGYHQSMGLGYFEYFQLCEDLGAEPLPVLAAGVPCQNSGHHHDGRLCGAGQQGGICMEEMGDYVQDVLDLIEYANGDPKTSKWAKMRAESGHPKPFRLKYLGIGNEDLITDVFKERFNMIFKAVKEKHPEVTVIGTVGPFWEGTDYETGWKFATQQQVPMVDEHYYNTPGWFINNQNYYDRYDRNKPKVYLGEYAAHLPGRPNNLETALAEALYLTAVERNGDVVSMTSYAPLLAKEGHTQWNPDLIYFNNTEVKPTSGYYTQLLYGQNAGDCYLPSEVKVDHDQEAVKRRIAVSVVRDTNTKDIIVKLVNMLPVQADVKVLLPSLKGLNLSATKTILTGHPTDKGVRPITDGLLVNESFDYEMPAYSFTVIRVHI